LKVYYGAESYLIFGVTQKNTILNVCCHQTFFCRRLIRVGGTMKRKRWGRFLISSQLLGAVDFSPWRKRGMLMRETCALNLLKSIEIAILIKAIAPNS